MSVYKKLMDAREQFHSLELKKTGHNKFAGYYYFELGDFLLPALKVFRQVGLCALPVSFTKETATMTIVNLDKPEERIVFESPMGSANLKGCHEVQNVGAVETYQRRYLWVAALEIVEHDALDATTGKDKAPVVIPESFRSSATMGAMDDVEEERRDYLRLFASIVVQKVSVGEVAYAHEKIEKEKFDSDEKTALWSLLDSKTRTAITKHVNALKAQQKEPA